MQILLTKVPFLGHILSAEGISVNTSKAPEVEDWNTPTSVTKIQSFLGLARYYCHFILDFYKIAKSMTESLHKDENFVWTQDCEIAFRTLREWLSTAPCLHNLMQRNLLMCFVMPQKLAFECVLLLGGWVIAYVLR